jgi:hypothetical protein
VVVLSLPEIDILLFRDISCNITFAVEIIIQKVGRMYPPQSHESTIFHHSSRYKMVVSTFDMFFVWNFCWLISSYLILL